MKQKEALEALKDGGNAFITGAAGSGKTFLLNKFIKWAKSEGKAVAVTASTGIASTHIGGKTIHSWSGIQLKTTLTDGEISKMMKKDYLRQHIKNNDILIIDEISMLHANQFDLINKVCKYFRQDVRPFGGLQVILSGDFFQLQPVRGMGFRSFVVNSHAWPELDPEICYLTEQHRHQDKKFLTLLKNIRSQTCTPADLTLLQSRVGAKLKSRIKPIKIYTHNTDVDSLNSMELAKINRKPKIYQMKSNGIENLVQTLKKNCLAPEDLILKRGAAVMFVKNNFKEEYINGTMGEVIDFDDEDNYPIVKTVEGKTIKVKPVSWTIDEQDDVLAEIAQVPLRLAWAITVHKSQGMSLDLTEIDLSKTFEYGMGYVALSRVRSLNGLSLIGYNEKSLQVDPQVTELDKKFSAE
ncbi:MAG: PIF1 family DEAD/DEAH box helicase [Candidatus Kerfeldbacteria bacterium]|jgi:ATP-dependent exoDNAse (exonuclease V) alpha subunit